MWPLLNVIAVCVLCGARELSLMSKCRLVCFAGWEIENGDPNGLQPEVLVSLTAPKQCARMFRGKRHYLGGRFVPPELAAKYELNLPEYPGTEPIVELPLH